MSPEERYYANSDEGEIKRLRERVERAEGVIAKAIAFRRACAREIEAGWLLDVDDRQAELFDALESYERRRTNSTAAEGGQG